jgi:orotidine-5'-phosphate decarboxylase
VAVVSARTPHVTPIVALDTPDRTAAERLVAQLGDACRFYKVGSELFVAEGPAVVRWLRDRGFEVFLDLKFHDIPNTVRGAVRSAAALGVSLVTVHVTGGRAMLDAAVEGAGTRVRVLGATVLTSLSESELGDAWGRSGVDVRGEVLRLATLARAAGLHGLVCAGEEAAAVRERHGEALRLLIPGIRLDGGAAHDQVRVVTPAAAAAAGASWVVLGRAVSAASDPVAAMARVRAALGATPGD